MCAHVQIPICMIVQSVKYFFWLTVASTLTETRQFYILYNTLEDQKAFMEKEVAIYIAT